MEIQEFIEKFAEVIDTEETLAPDTVFSDLDEWTSMAVVQIIVMIDEEAGVSLTTEEIRKCDTIRTLYNLISK